MTMPTEEVIRDRVRQAFSGFVLCVAEGDADKISWPTILYAPEDKMTHDEQQAYMSLAMGVSFGMMVCFLRSFALTFDMTLERALRMFYETLD